MCSRLCLEQTMPRFQICPTDQSHSSAEVVTPDAGAVLGLVHRLDCKEADVFRDGDYCFSVSLSKNGLWSIFKRQHDNGETARTASFG